MNEQRPIAVGMGELLWDLLPGGKQLGGAPFNFARHCGQFGMESFPVSRVGADRLGNEVISSLRSWNITSNYVSLDSLHSTGAVEVALDDHGKPTYTIREGVAWDFLSHSANLKELALQVDLICFGTLAQRSEVSRSAIYSFLDLMRPDALKLFDVNLRQNYFSIENLNESLRRANVLKLSDEELPALKNGFSLSGPISKQLSDLRTRFDLKLVAYTRGAEGSVLVDDSGLHEHPGYPIEVVDTIGAGDSFSATLCIGLMQGLPLCRLNENANKVAAYVCSQPGATPGLPHDLVAKISTSSKNEPQT